MNCLQASLGTFTQSGIALLEKEPPRFECLDDGTGEWRECSKAEICGGNIPRDHYRYDEDQEEYIDNWVDQYELLCEPKWKIGLIGSMYFAGVVSTILLIPWLSDKWGRRWIVTSCYSILILATIGLMLASNLTTLYILVFIIGSTFGGRIISGMNWLVEFQQVRKKELVVFIKMLTVSAWIILVTAIFQFGTKHWLIVAAIFVTLCAIGTIWIIFNVPESCQYLHGKKRYEEAREGLVRVADKNSVYVVGKNVTAPYSQFKFTQELGLTAKEMSKLEPIEGQEDS